MGVITLTLNSPAPYWIIAIAGLAIGLGTYGGGWRYSAVSSLPTLRSWLGRPEKRQPVAGGCRV
jgi:hypothetical protein